MAAGGKRTIKSGVMTAAIMCVMFFVMLILVVFSASAYRSAVSIQRQNGEARAALGYVITAVKANKTDRVYLDTADGMQTLVISDGVTGLEQRIYCRGGELIENYGAAGQEMRADGGVVIGHPGEFRMSMETDSLLRIETDLGSSYVDIGCAGGEK